jgi:branched-chain amino acid transport system ATP-binding protein
MNILLKVKDLSIAFGGLKAVDNLSFEMNHGEIYGIIGPNVAGKTTAFNCITQFYKPDAGTIMFDSKLKGMMNLVELKPHQVIRHGLVRTFQNVELVNTLSVIDNLMVGAHIAFRSTFFEQVLRLPRARREERAMRKRAEEVLTLLGLAHIRDLPAVMQPYGHQKKLELARTLMMSPKLIILDEPAAGLNDVETQGLIDIVRKIPKEMDCGILLIEHDMNFVNKLCHRVCAINFGKLLAIGTPDEIKAHQDVQEAYLGKAEEEM